MPPARAPTLTESEDEDEVGASAVDEEETARVVGEARVCVVVLRETPTPAGQPSCRPDRGDNTGRRTQDR